MLHEEVKLPIFFAYESDELNSYYSYIQNERANQMDASAFQTLMDSIITDGFQFAINSAQNQAIVHSAQSFQAVNLQGKLNGGVINRESSTKQKIPTIIITANYDAMGLATVNYFSHIE